MRKSACNVAYERGWQLSEAHQIILIGRAGSEDPLRYSDHTGSMKEEAGMHGVTKIARALVCTILCVGILPAARPQDDAKIAHRKALENELESIAIIERKVMVPMRDGKRMQADIYRPKDPSKKYPILFVRTPYNFNYWDVELGAPSDMSEELEAIKHGYAFVQMNERGRYFSEGDYDILGVPLTDSDDALDWMGSQPWSADKVGLIGCSSTAEWQLAVASRGNKALTTFLPESFGAGVGRVRPYYEQGNWFRGGAVQMLFAPWVYDSGLQTKDGRPGFSWSLRPGRMTSPRTRPLLIGAVH